MVTNMIGKAAGEVEGFAAKRCGASRLGPEARKRLSVAALAGAEPVSRLAEDCDVSRKFVYTQARKAQRVLDEAFDGDKSKNQDVLFHLPVTKAWIEQFVLAQVLIGHTSFRGVDEIMEAVFNHHISVGAVHTIVRRAIEKARELNALEDLSSVRVGAHDEIYQAGSPVLVGMDVFSTYCYLLSLEEHADETTWGVHLLELVDRGLAPQRTIGDGGLGLRNGQAAAWENVPCDGDVFHAAQKLTRLARSLSNRAKGCVAKQVELEAKMVKLKCSGDGRSLASRLGTARRQARNASRLAETVATITDWMLHDVLSKAGPDLATRRELYAYLVAELQSCETRRLPQIRKVRRYLENQRESLLGFVRVLDKHFGRLSERFGIPLYWVHRVCEMQRWEESDPAYWQHRQPLQAALKDRFHALEQAVRQVMDQTPRASSIVENLNSRLRCYFFLRRHIGGGYLDLLRFFLNHRRLRRSDRPERVGKSPAELLTGSSHAHWLTLLGHERFARS